MVIGFAANRGDYILSFAVVVQSLLVIFQQCLIAILHMEPESTTIYRVVLSAIPVILALYYVWGRKKLLCINVYVVTILILLMHAEDQLMSAETIKVMALEIIRLNERVAALEK